MKSLMRSICFAAGDRAVPVRKSPKRGSLSNRGTVTWPGWITAGCNSEEEGTLATVGLGAEGRGLLAGKCGTVDAATGNTLPVKRHSSGRNTWRKAVACIVKLNDSRFAIRRRRSVFLFELFSAAGIG